MKAKDLRNSILMMAIQGKLVEQNPHDEPASVLLEKIRAEKAELIKQKKIKKEKSLPEITEEEKPFDLPNGWDWVRLADVLVKISDGTHHSPVNMLIGDYPYITAKNIKENGICLENITYVTEKVHKEIYSRCNPEYGDLLYIKDGATTGIVTINTLRHEFSMLSSVALLKVSSIIFNKYLMYVLRSPYFYELMRGRMSGTGITRVTLRKLQESIIALPPLDEQQRIVARLDELMPQIDKYEQAETTLTSFEQEFPDKMRSSILQAAVQGKLVAQNPQDKPASVLLEKIRAEKAELIKQKKIKKEKPLPEITEEEKPFDLPEGWEWVRLINLSYNIHYGYTASAQSVGNAQLLRITDIQGNKVDWKSVPWCTISDKEFKTYGLKNRDIMIARTGGTIGKSYVVADIDKNAVFASYLIRIQPALEMNEKYLKLFLESPAYWKQLTDASMGTGQPNVNGQALKNLCISCPPLKEQQRIVAKVEEMFGFCDHLKEV